MKFDKTLGLSLLVVFSLSAWAAEPVRKLPPKKKNPSQGEALGESRAVEEARRMAEEKQSTDISSAVPPILVSPTANDALESAKKSEDKVSAKASSSAAVVTGATTAATVGPEIPRAAKVEEDASVRASSELPQSKLWFVLEKKPEFGFLAGWAFTRKELSTLVGDGFSYGFLGAQEIVPGIQGQIRLSGSHFNEKTETRRSSLNLFPFELLAQFSRSSGPVSFYLQPGLGGALWRTRSERLVDNRLQQAHGFDFMASAGLGFNLKLPESRWKVGADASMAYVSGYFDNYFSRILVYSSYQF
jgi:hypothetical protein